MYPLPPRVCTVAWPERMPTASVKSTSSAAAGQPVVTGVAVQYGLRDRLLLDRVEDLVFAEPAPTPLGHEPRGRLPATSPISCPLPWARTGTPS